MKLSMEGSEKEWVKYLVEGLSRHRPDLNPAQRLLEAKKIYKSKRIENINPDLTSWIGKDIGIYCLSSVKDDLLMWSHYTESHTGFVLEFDSTQHYFGRSFPVKYSENYPSTRIFDDGLKRMEASVLTKSTHWSYENEYRIIEHKTGAGVYRYPPEQLKGVILGCKMNEKFRKHVINLAESHPFKPNIFQAKMKNREFGLHIENIP